MDARGLAPNSILEPMVLLHARTGDAAVLTGYMGKSTAFEDALADLRHLVSRGLHFALVNRVEESRLDDLVEDFSQDALLRIMENLDSFRGESKFITWATKVAVRVAYSELRRKRWKRRTPRFRSV